MASFPHEKQHFQCSKWLLFSVGQNKFCFLFAKIIYNGSCKTNARFSSDLHSCFASNKVIDGARPLLFAQLYCSKCIPHFYDLLSRYQFSYYLFIFCTKRPEQIRASSFGHNLSVRKVLEARKYCKKFFVMSAF